MRLACLRSGAVKFFSKPVPPIQMSNLWLVRRPSAADLLATQATGSGRSASVASADSLDAAAGGGGGGGFDLPSVSSSRVERLLRERELMRRVRSMTGMDADGASLECPPPSAAVPLSSASRLPSVDSLPAMDRVPEVEPRQRLIVVANRLPVSAKKRKDGAWALEISAGGLVSALLGIQKNYDICWIGWPGECVPPAEQPVLSAALAKEACVPVFLDAECVELYYNGYCNNVLWPLFHYVPLPFEARLEDSTSAGAQWDAYKAANALFATAVLSQYCEGDVVWCHDYHLMLLPALLRDRVPRMKVGWFLHTPFPSSEIYRTLPLREKLLNSVLKADLIGFHTYDYARHFVSACTRILGLEGTPEGVECSGVSVRVAAFPIGIDPDRFTRAIDSEGVRDHIAELRSRFAGRKIMLGVDRLDMIKGIPQKLLGFERFLDEHPEWRDKVLLVQIAVPTRTNVREYKRLANQARDTPAPHRFAAAHRVAFRRPSTPQVHEIVGRINGRFGSLAAVPIHHLDRSLAFDELCALYAATDVALVTSLRDGMNLVSYEYCACQQANAGVLILSEFAGAAQSLGAGAILVNPWNVRDLAEAIHEALTMCEGERRERQRQNFSHITQHTAQSWADTFVSELNDTHVAAALRTTRIPPQLAPRAAASVFGAASERLLLLGFNNTLTAAVEAPRRARQQYDHARSQVTLHPASEAALARLAEDERTTVCVVSGASRARLEEFFGSLRVWLVAENGVFMRSPDHAGAPPGAGWVTCAEQAHLEWLESVQLVFDYFAERTPRSFVERRETSLVWNYKYSDPEFGRLQARDLLQHLWTGPISNAAVDVIQGLKSVEVRPTGISKGVAIDRILRDLGERRGGAGPAAARPPVDFALCVGHFLGRDEDIFSHVVEFVDSGGAEEGGGDGVWTAAPRETQRKPGRGGGAGSRVSNAAAAAAADAAAAAADAANECGGCEEAQERTRAFTCTVGRKRSQARYYLTDSEDVATLLEELCERLPGGYTRYARPSRAARDSESTAGEPPGAASRPLSRMGGDSPARDPPSARGLQRTNSGELANLPMPV